MEQHGIKVSSLLLITVVSYPSGNFPGGSDGKASAYNVGDLGSIPWLGRSPWRRKWQPTPVLLPGKSRGRRNLVGYSPWGRKESDMTENFTFTFKSVVESPWCGGNLQNPHGYNLPADGCSRALHPALSVAASEPGDLLAGGECTTRIRWAVSNVTSASGRQRSLQHFSWPSLHNHPRLQLM